mmetsp:Transcript_7071/g.9233  ORF Transcript_7071/g.9233 Transcript_7071/m.9233 type:complete len:249 (-) Transcript_7071:648-1394(-)
MWSRIPILDRINSRSKSFSKNQLFLPLKCLYYKVASHHFGAILAFALARLCLYSHFTSLLKNKPTLRAMSRAAELEQWKVTFLSRFVFMPVQLKNYVFGVLPVSFKCFFFMALIGDFQSAVFAVYLGSLSKNVLDSTVTLGTTEGGETVHLQDGSKDDSAEKSAQHFFWIISVVLAVSMTTIASIIARRSYNKVIRDLEIETGEDFEKEQMLEEGSHYGDTESLSPHSPRGTQELHISSRSWHNASPR